MGKLTYTTAEVQALLDFYNGANTASSLANIPTSRQMVYATVNSNQTVSVASGLTPGKAIHVLVRNSGATDRTITIPTTGNYVSMSGASKTLPAGGWIEISIACYANNSYNIRVGEGE